MSNQGITHAADIVDLIYDVLKLNKMPGGDVVAVYPIGMDKVDVTLYNGRRYMIEIKRTNSDEVE